MTTRGLFLVVSWLTVSGLLLTGCGPAAQPTPTAKPVAPQAPATAAVPSAPASATAKAAAPTPSPKAAVDQPRYGGILTISSPQDPASWDMHEATEITVTGVIQSNYSTLTQLNPDNPDEIIPDAAKTWAISNDGLVYTFNLRDNIKFHDGSILTAEDARFSFDRMINPPSGIRSPRRSNFAAVDKVEAPDKNTVKFTLKYPSGSFLNVVSLVFMVIYSKPFVEKKGNMRGDVMGSGPFKPKRLGMGSVVEQVKNPDYFVPGRPYLDGLTFYIIKDYSTRLAAFRTGQIRLTGTGPQGLTAADAETIKKTMPQAVIMPYPAFSRSIFSMNTQREPWKDVRVRKAADLAIDRQNAIKVLDQGYGDLGSHFPGAWGIPKEEMEKMPGVRQPKDADIAEAKRLLVEAGYPSGFTEKVLVRAEKQFQELSVYVADQLAKIGIKVELDVKEPVVRSELLAVGNYNSHPAILSYAFPDPDDELRYWGKPRGDDWAQNWQRADDQKIWDLFDQQSRAVDPAQRKRLVRELDLRMIELSLTPIINWKNAILGMWPEVKNRGKVAGHYSFQKYQDIWLAK
ncbi:MAG: ABC transporter substrate-binding protein [Chloroflexi bacterium]|nr:ABC transporter substrate-binding protein [Chloroflexota bacterium]